LPHFGKAVTTDSTCHYVGAILQRLVVLIPLFGEMAHPTHAAPNHDWRSPSYVSVVGGHLFDPLCVPLESVRR
jgi:hypothetical protein